MSLILNITADYSDYPTPQQSSVHSQLYFSQSQIKCSFRRALQTIDFLWLLREKVTSFTVLGGQKTGDSLPVLRSCFVFGLFNKDKPISEYRDWSPSSPAWERRNPAVPVTLCC